MTQKELFHMLFNDRNDHLQYLIENDFPKEHILECKEKMIDAVDGYFRAIVEEGNKLVEKGNRLLQVRDDDNRLLEEHIKELKEELAREKEQNKALKSVLKENLNLQGKPIAEALKEENP